jgi:hypothetical protein
MRKEPLPQAIGIIDFASASQISEIYKAGELREGRDGWRKKPETIVETSATKSGRHSKVTGDGRNPSTEIN